MYESIDGPTQIMDGMANEDKLSSPDYDEGYGGSRSSSIAPLSPPPSLSQLPQHPVPKPRVGQPLPRRAREALEGSHGSGGTNHAGKEKLACPLLATLPTHDAAPQLEAHATTRTGKTRLSASSVLTETEMSDAESVAEGRTRKTRLPVMGHGLEPADEIWDTPPTPLSGDFQMLDCFASTETLGTRRAPDMVTAKPLSRQCSRTSSVQDPEIASMIDTFMRTKSADIKRGASVKVDLRAQLGIGDENVPPTMRSLASAVPQGGTSAGPQECRTASVNAAGCQLSKGRLDAMPMAEIEDHLRYLVSKMNLLNMELKTQYIERDDHIDTREKLEEILADKLGALNETYEVATYELQKKELDRMAHAGTTPSKKRWFR